MINTVAAIEPIKFKEAVYSVKIPANRQIKIKDAADQKKLTELIQEQTKQLFNSDKVEAQVGRWSIKLSVHIDDASVMKRIEAYEGIGPVFKAVIQKSRKDYEDIISKLDLDLDNVKQDGSFSFHIQFTSGSSNEKYKESEHKHDTRILDKALEGFKDITNIEKDEDDPYSYTITVPAETYEDAENLIEHIYTKEQDITGFGKGTIGQTKDTYKSLKKGMKNAVHTHEEVQDKIKKTFKDLYNQIEDYPGVFTDNRDNESRVLDIGIRCQHMMDTLVHLGRLNTNFSSSIRNAIGYILNKNFKDAKIYTDKGNVSIKAAKTLLAKNPDLYKQLPELIKSLGITGPYQFDTKTSEFTNADVSKDDIDRALFKAPDMEFTDADSKKQPAPKKKDTSVVDLSDIQLLPGTGSAVQDTAREIAKDLVTKQTGNTEGTHLKTLMNLTEAYLNTSVATQKVSVKRPIIAIANAVVETLNDLGKVFTGHENVASEALKDFNNKIKAGIASTHPELNEVLSKIKTKEDAETYKPALQNILEKLSDEMNTNISMQKMFENVQVLYYVNNLMQHFTGEPVYMPDVLQLLKKSTTTAKNEKTLAETDEKFAAVEDELSERYDRMITTREDDTAARLEKYDNNPDPVEFNALLQDKKNALRYNTYPKTEQEREKVQKEPGRYLDKEEPEQVQYTPETSNYAGDLVDADGEKIKPEQKTNKDHDEFKIRTRIPYTEEQWEQAKKHPGFAETQYKVDYHDGYLVAARGFGFVRTPAAGGGVCFRVKSFIDNSETQKDDALPYTRRKVTFFTSYFIEDGEGTKKCPVCKADLCVPFDGRHFGDAIVCSKNSSHFKEELPMQDKADLESRDRVASAVERTKVGGHLSDGKGTTRSYLKTELKSDYTNVGSEIVATKNLGERPEQKEETRFDNSLQQSDWDAFLEESGDYYEMETPRNRWNKTENEELELAFVDLEHSVNTVNTMQEAEYCVNEYNDVKQQVQESKVDEASKTSLFERLNIVENKLRKKIQEIKAKMKQPEEQDTPDQEPEQQPEQQPEQKEEEQSKQEPEENNKESGFNVTFSKVAKQYKGFNFYKNISEE